MTAGGSSGDRAVTGPDDVLSRIPPDDQSWETPR